jgi:hypothetical protein
MDLKISKLLQLGETILYYARRTYGVFGSRKRNRKRKTRKLMNEVGLKLV